MRGMIFLTFVMAWIVSGCGIHSNDTKINTETAVLVSHSKTGPFKSSDDTAVGYRGQYDTCLNENKDLAGREQYCEELVLAGRPAQPAGFGYYPNTYYGYGRVGYGQVGWYTTPGNGPAVIR